MKKILLFSLSIAFIASLNGQTIQLSQLQTSSVVEGTRAGQLGLTNSQGKQQYAQYVEVNLNPIDYVPTPTGNTENLSEFVIDSLDRVWFIDWEGKSVVLRDTAGTDDKNGYYGGNGGNGGDGTIPSSTTSTVTDQLQWQIEDGSGLPVLRVNIENETDFCNFMSFVEGNDSLLIRNSDDNFGLSTNKDMSLVAAGQFSATADSARMTTVAANASSRVFVKRNPGAFGAYAHQSGINWGDLNQAVKDSIGINIYTSNGSTPQDTVRYYKIGLHGELIITYPNGSIGYEQWGGTTDGFIALRASLGNKLEINPNGLDVDLGSGDFFRVDGLGMELDVRRQKSYLRNTGALGDALLYVQDTTSKSAMIVTVSGSDTTKVGINRNQGDGMYVMIADTLPHPGQILVAGSDSTFYFEQTSGGAVLANEGITKSGDTLQLGRNGGSPITVGADIKFPRNLINSGPTWLGWGAIRFAEQVEGAPLSIVGTTDSISLLNIMNTGPGSVNDTFSSTQWYRNAMYSTARYRNNRFSFSQLSPHQNSGFTAGYVEDFGGIDVAGRFYADRNNTRMEYRQNVDSFFTVTCDPGHVGLYAQRVTTSPALNRIQVYPDSTLAEKTIAIDGNLRLKTAGNKIQIATGSNASIGVGTLVGGTLTVSTTAVATGSLIFLQRVTAGGTIGDLTYTISGGTSFTVNSGNPLDTSTFNWWIVN